MTSTNSKNIKQNYEVPTRELLLDISIKSTSYEIAGSLMKIEVVILADDSTPTRPQCLIDTMAEISTHMRNCANEWETLSNFIGLDYQGASGDFHCSLMYAEYYFELISTLKGNEETQAYALFCLGQKLLNDIKDDYIALVPTARLDGVEL